MGDAPNPFPYRVRASECPLASMHNVPSRTLDDARHIARWMGDFIHRVMGKSYVITISLDDAVVDSATSDEWRQ